MHQALAFQAPRLIPLGQGQAQLPFGKDGSGVRENCRPACVQHQAVVTWCVSPASPARVAGVRLPIATCERVQHPIRRFRGLASVILGGPAPAEGAVERHQRTEMVVAGAHLSVKGRE